MGIPTWTVGEVLASADVNSWFVPQAAYYTGSGQTVNSTGLTNVTGMAISSLPTGTYQVLANVFWSPNQSAGSAKLEFVTSTATITPMQLNWYEIATQASPGGAAAIGNSGEATALSQNMQSSTMGTADRQFVLTGMMTVTVAGDFTLQAACSTGSDTWVIKFGTFMVLQRVN